MQLKFLSERRPPSPKIKEAKMRNMIVIVALTTFCLLTMLPQSSFAQCATGAANDDLATAIRSFGTQNADPIEINYGESFVIDCDAHLTSVEATINLTEVMADGRHPAVMGNLVQCTVYDSAKVAVMSEQLAIPTTEVEQKLTFDFSNREFRLAAGQYYFLLSTPEDCWAYIRMGSEYADGDATLYMLDTWTTQSGDTMFNIQWDASSTLVSAQEMSWGATKGLYR